MKRLVSVLSSLLLLPAFAEVAPVYYDDFIEYSDENLDDEEYNEYNTTEQVAPVKNAKQPMTPNRTTSVSRTVSSTTATNSGSRSGNVSSRAVSSSPRSTTSTSRGTVSRAARTQNVISRGTQSATTSRSVVSARSATQNKGTSARVSVNSPAMVATSRTSSGTGTTTLTDSGNPLYYSNTNAARVGVSSRRSTAARSSSILATDTTPVISEEAVTSTANNLTAIAELTEYCKAQYAACMDNYCNVLDDNQGRCSCSKNLKNYAKTEESLANATSEFQEAIQKIRYIGLTGPQIESLFTETEAELSMKSASDTSKLKTSLDAIKKKIIDVSTPAGTTAENTTGLSLDVSGLLNADFTAGFDLNSFLNLGTSSSSTVSNQRGEQLFKTATNRCKATVLNSCTAQGIDANMITNSYDLEIDKQCIAYERSLNEANAEMKNNVTNAINILQQARLMLAQNKNSYDLRGCVAAIDSCMQDEYVCGTDYELCLDPTGKYLANGAIVKGSTPGVSGGQPINTTELNSTTINTWTSGGMYDLYATWNYEYNTTMANAWSNGSQENLGGYIDYWLDDWGTYYAKYNNSLKTNSMATYLLQKIGYIDENDTVHGMCASAMKQCQDYTFETKKSSKSAKVYKADNEVVRQYLASAMSKIKVQQDAILSDYAENCRTDVTSCLTTNGYDEENTDSTASRTAVNACSSEITTCMSVSGYKPLDGTKLTLRSMTDWVASMFINCPVNTYLYDDGTGYGTIVGSKSTASIKNSVRCEACKKLPILEDGVLITCSVGGNSGFLHVDKATTSSGGQVKRCDCPDGYENDTYYSETGSLGEFKPVCRRTTGQNPNPTSSTCLPF